MTDPNTVLAVAAGIVSLVTVLCGLVMRQTATQLAAVKALLPLPPPSIADTSAGHRAVADMLDLGERVARLEVIATTTAAQLGELKCDLAELVKKVDALGKTLTEVAVGFSWLQLACEHCQPPAQALRIAQERKP